MAISPQGPVRGSDGMEFGKAFLVADVVKSTAQWSQAPSFIATWIKSSIPMPDRTQPIATEAALLVALRFAELPKGKLRYWSKGRELNVPYVPQDGILIYDLEDNPSIQTYSSVNTFVFYITRATLQDVAEDLGVRPLGRFPRTFYDPDPFVTQVVNLLLPHLLRTDSPALLTLDYLALLLNAHLLQQYGKCAGSQISHRGGLSIIQRRKATEILRENLAGKIPLKEVASQCGLSVSHFARGFRASFGVSMHKWLIQRRIEYAQELMRAPSLTLADIALRSGFADQPAFTRAFVALCKETPGRWRRNQAM